MTVTAKRERGASGDVALRIRKRTTVMTIMMKMMVIMMKMMARMILMLKIAMIMVMIVIMMMMLKIAMIMTMMLKIAIILTVKALKQRMRLVHHHEKNKIFFTFVKTKRMMIRRQGQGLVFTLTSPIPSTFPTQVCNQLNAY